MKNYYEIKRGEEVIIVKGGHKGKTGTVTDFFYSVDVKVLLVDKDGFEKEIRKPTGSPYQPIYLPTLDPIGVMKPASPTEITEITKRVFEYTGEKKDGMYIYKENECCPKTNKWRVILEEIDGYSIEELIEFANKLKGQTNTNKNMLQKPTNTMKKHLPTKIKKQYKAGFRDGDLELTSEGVDALLELLADKEAEEFTKLAEERIKELKEE